MKQNSLYVSVIRGPRTYFQVYREHITTLHIEDMRDAGRPLCHHHRLPRLDPGRAGGPYWKVASLRAMAALYWPGKDGLRVCRRCWVSYCKRYGEPK